MEGRNINRILIWIVIILLATNISMALSFVFHRKQEKTPIENNLKENLRIPAGQRTRFFREQLNLTYGQMEPVRELNREYNRKSNLIAHDLESLRVEMVVELGANPPSEERLGEITKEIGQLHTELKNATIDYYKKLSNICNAEQQERLNQMFLSILENAGNNHPGHKGRRHRYRNQ